MRKLIAGMKISLDGKFEGPEGYAGWVHAWSEDYGMTAQIDACLLGAGMYRGYEKYWSSIQSEPNKPVWITGQPPTPAEIKWASFAAKTPITYSQRLRAPRNGRRPVSSARSMK